MVLTPSNPRRPTFVVPTPYRPCSPNHQKTHETPKEIVIYSHILLRNFINIVAP